MKSLLYAGIIILSFAWFPHSLERIHHLGYDFPIIYLGAHHVFDIGWTWSYNLWVLVYPLSWFNLDTAFGIFYALSVLAWLEFAKRYTVLSILAAYPMLLSLELGHNAPILAWLCLSFSGSFVAMLWKPYLGIFFVLHAYLRSTRIHTKRRGDIPPGVLENKPYSTNPPLGDYHPNL